MPYLLRDIYGQEFPVTGVIQIGRDPACQILLSDPQASRLHAIVWEDGGRLLLRDENSRNGTFVNGRRVHHATLQPGDHIRIGDTTLSAAAYPGGTQLPVLGQTPGHPSMGLTRTQIFALVAGGVLLLCVLLAGSLVLTYPYYANNLTFLPQRPVTPVAQLPGANLVVLSTSEPQPLFEPLEYATTTENLAQSIANLNRAELQFIQDAQATNALTPGISMASLHLSSHSNSLDDDLCTIAAQAMNTGQTAESLIQTAVWQGGGSGAAGQVAGQYSSIARLSYALVIETQDLRQGLQSGTLTPAAGVNKVAEYGAQLWNPSVTQAGIDSNPFVDYVDNLDLITPGQFLNDSAIAGLMAQMGQSNERLSWLANSTEVITKTIHLPSSSAQMINPDDPGLLQSLTTAVGQANAEQSRQVAALKLTALVPPDGQSSPEKAPADTTFQVYKGVAMADKAAIQALKYPSFSKGQASSVTKITSAQELVATTFDLGGEKPPQIKNSEPIKKPKPGITIKIEEIQEDNRKKYEDSTFEIYFNVQISWQIQGYVDPSFKIACTNGQWITVSSDRGSQILNSQVYVTNPSEPISIYCFASRPSSLYVFDAQTHGIVKINGNQIQVEPTFTETPTQTMTPTFTETLTITPSATLNATDDTIGTESAAQKTAEFVATVTEIARQTEKARANGVYTLNGTFGTETNASACFPGTHSSGILTLIVDFGQKLVSGKLSGAGNMSSFGISCNSMTYDLSCSFSYTGTFNGTIDPTSGALAGVSGPDTTISSCQYSNCKTNGVASACPGSTNGASIPGSVTLTGTIDKTSLTGKGNISVCPGCRGDWSAGQ